MLESSFLILAACAALLSSCPAVQLSNCPVAFQLFRALAKGQGAKGPWAMGEPGRLASGSRFMRVDHHCAQCRGRSQAGQAAGRSPYVWYTEIQRRHYTPHARPSPLSVSRGS